MFPCFNFLLISCAYISTYVCMYRTFTLHFRAFPKYYDKDLFKAHTEVLFKGLLIHLDDPSQEIQVCSFKVNKHSFTFSHNKYTTNVHLFNIHAQNNSTQEETLSSRP